ncbi:hypothetical protein JYK22_20635 [Nonomuraea sp. RK-328]|nr:hypothetical protein [Nonomuraea sp. RK-328]
MGDATIWRIDRQAQDQLREQRSHQETGRERPDAGGPPADAGNPHQHRPPSQLRSRDGADGDPVSNPYQGLQERSRGEGSAQKPTEQGHAGQYRTDFHDIVSGSIPKDSPGTQDHRPGSDPGTGGQRP